MATTMSATQVSKSIFILPKPQPGVSTLPGGSILMEGTTVLDSAKRLALSGTSPTATPSPLQKKMNGTDSTNNRCKRKLNFAKLGLPAGTKHNSPKTVEKRNLRERNRVKTINETFVDLRDHLPCGNGIMQRKKQKKMSKVDILKGAIDYITMMQDIIDETDSSIVGSPASPALSCSPTPSTPSTPQHSTAPLNIPSPQQSLTHRQIPFDHQQHPASMQMGGYTTYQSSLSSMLPSSPVSNTSYPHTPSYSQQAQSFNFPSSFSQGNFLDALTDAASTVNVDPVDLVGHHNQPLIIQAGSPNPALRSPGSVCSNTESTSTASPAQSAASMWTPDEDDILQLASWFQ